jgi:hypothetical protein
VCVVCVCFFFFCTMVLPGHSGPWPLIQFRNHFSQMVGLLGRVISPLQGHCLNTGQHKHRINTYTPNIHALSGIRTHDTSVGASEDSSCLRPRGHCDWLSLILRIIINVLDEHAAPNLQHRLLYPEDGDRRFLRNFDTNLPHLRGQYFVLP